MIYGLPPSQRFHRPSSYQKGGNRDGDEVFLYTETLVLDQSNFSKR